jgi:hypothetical protein
MQTGLIYKIIKNTNTVVPDQRYANGIFACFTLFVLCYDVNNFVASRAIWLFPFF